MKKFLLILAALMIFNAPCSAEDLKFIDALDDTGYYYDADTVKTESGSVLTVRMAVIKASLNRMYTYDVRINHASRTYEILSSKTFSYDTRAVLDRKDTRRPPLNYSENSEMGQMVRLILHGY